MLEVIGGVILLFVRPDDLSHFIATITQYQLSRDPHDFIATHILDSTHHLAGTLVFGIIYLLFNGALKIVLATALHYHKHWAFPVGLGFLAAFMLYQVYRIGYDHSIFLIILTLIDVIIFTLIWKEWQRLDATHKFSDT